MSDNPGSEWMVSGHEFTPMYPGVDEWKQLCVWLDEDGEVCGRSRPNHKVVER